MALATGEHLPGKIEDQTEDSLEVSQKISGLNLDREQITELLNNFYGVPQLASYKMKEQSRGLCIIINNLKFEELVCRNGAEKDETILKDLFEKELYFTVEVKRNLKRDDMIKAAEDYGKIDHSKFDAFVFIIMTHGNYQDSIYGVDGRKARVEDIMSEFNGERCASLRGKPKLFFIQACRGSPVEWPCDTDKGYDPDSTLSKGLCPQEADFLLAFSTAPGSLSWRDETGARFIQVLVSVIRQYHHRYHLLDMLVEVTRQVVEKGNGAHNSQVPAPSNTLRAQVFL